MGVSNYWADKKSTDVSADKTLAAVDCGTIQNITADAKVITLPSTAAGLTFTIRNGGVAAGSTAGSGADGSVLVTISPAAADKIMGAGLTAADNKDLLNTKATSRVGDYVKLVGDGVDGWYVHEMVGTWAREA